MIRDLQFAIRSIWRSKLFAVTALVAFSFGIGACTTVFSVIDAVLLRPATFFDPGSVDTIQSSEDKKEWGGIPPWAYDRMRSHTELFSEVTASRTAVFTVTRVPVPDQVFGLSVSGNFFQMVAARPWRGRLLLPEDDRPGAPRVVLLSYKGWRQLFAGDPNVIGKTAEIDGDLYTVIGIMPSDFIPPGANGGGSLWTTLRLTAAELAAPNARRLDVTARLRRSVSLGRVQSVLDALASSQPSTAPVHGSLRFLVSQWHPETNASHRLILWLAMGMVSGLLLIGCANLASILLARAIGRRRDYAIRLATGASRVQIIRQSLLEVSILAFAALLVAAAGSSAALHLIRDSVLTAQTHIPNLGRIQLDSQTLLFSFGVACLAALMCGLFPAFSASSIDLSTALRETGTHAAGGKSATRFLHFVVAVEAGISMILLLTSGLLIRSLVRLMSDDHALRPDHVLTLRMPTGSWQRLSRKQSEEDRHRQIQHYLELMYQAQELHGVRAAALASSLPLSNTVVTTRFEVRHGAASGQSQEIGPITQAVTRDYFRVMGIPLLSGRTFEARDSGAKLQVALVNQAFVQEYFSGEDPIGKFLYDAGRKAEIQIIGVVKNSPHLDFAETVKPELYLDFEQTLLTPFLTGLVIRTQDNPQSIAQKLRETLSFKDAEQAVVHLETLRELIDQNVWQPRFSAWLFSAFAVIALCLSGIGIYGVIAYITMCRRRDFGIRLSLGADPPGLFGLAVMQSLKPVIAGISLGVLGSYWTSRWISSLLYKTGPLDAGATLASAAILVCVAFAATAAPALRAARVDPAIILRSE